MAMKKGSKRGPATASRSSRKASSKSSPKTSAKQPSPSLRADMRASELRYRRLFEEAPYGIVLADVGTRRITQINPFLTELLGASRAHFVGREMKALGFFDSARAYRAAIQELDEKGQLKLEDTPLKDSQGRVHRVELTARVYKEQVRPVVQWNVRDVSEHRYAEELHARLAAIVQSSDACSATRRAKRWAGRSRS
jgi:PAS domain S-box-containing protein